MAYIIYNNDGSILVTLPDGDVDSVSTSLDLIGKNVNNYGQFVNQNLVKILNNFASETGNEPRSPQPGQLWFNKTTKRLTVYDGNSFKPTYGATVSGTEPTTTSTGDLWYDSANSQLKIWDGYAYKLVAPQVSGIYGKFGIEPPIEIIEDQITGDPAKVGFLYAHGRALAMITSGTFLMSETDAGIYLNASSSATIKEGLTVIGDLDIYDGNLYINGLLQVPPVKTLTASADITYFGDPTGADLAPLNTTTLEIVYNRIQTANIWIRERILDLLFSTTTVFTNYPYPGSSEARVVCQFNTSTTVRHFKMENYSTIPGFDFPYWKPFEVYTTNFDTEEGVVSTLTNIIPVLT